MVRSGVFITRGALIVYQNKHLIYKEKGKLSLTKSPMSCFISPALFVNMFYE